MRIICSSYWHLSGKSIQLYILVMLAGCSWFGGGPDQDTNPNEVPEAFIAKKQAECVVALTKEEQKFALQNIDQIESVWVGEEEALRVRLVTSSRLNEHVSLPHALTVGVFQATKPDAVVKEVTRQSGLRRMLLLDNLDESIVQYDIQTLQPRSSVRLDISRADNTRYLVVIAGYQSLVSTEVVRIVQWPLVRFTRSILNPINWFTDEPKPFPAKLDVLVRLGDQKIQDFVVQVRNQCQ